jgi:hypothetical protein
MAKRFYRVQDGDRPDLAAIGSTSQLDVKGYAFPKIFPLLAVTEKGGTMTVAKAGLTNAKGTKGRANGTELKAEDAGTVDVNWTAVRYEGRGRLYENDASAYASAEAADAAGAELAQRLAWNIVEDDAFNTVFSASRIEGATELPDKGVIKSLQKTARSLRKFGRATLVMTTNAWDDFVTIPEIRHHLQALAGAGSDIGFIMTDIEKVRAAVSTFLSFDNIILFDSDIVGTDADSMVAVIGLRSALPGQNISELAKTKAVYGFTPVYIPEGAPADKPFDMYAWYDKKSKANVYDAEAYLGVKEAFADAVVVHKFAESYSEFPVSIVNLPNGAAAASADPASPDSPDAEG